MPLDLTADSRPEPDDDGPEADAGMTAPHEDAFEDGGVVDEDHPDEDAKDEDDEDDDDDAGDDESGEDEEEDHDR